MKFFENPSLNEQKIANDLPTLIRQQLDNF